MKLINNEILAILRKALCIAQENKTNSAFVERVLSELDNGNSIEEDDIVFLTEMVKERIASIEKTEAVKRLETAILDYEVVSYLATVKQANARAKQSVPI